MKMKINTIGPIVQRVNKLDCKNMSVNSLQKLVALNKELSAKGDEHRKLLETIMESFEVPAENGRYDFEKHKDKDKIQEKLVELENHDFDVENVKFMTSDEFYAAGKTNLNLQEITLMADIFIIEEKKKQ